MQIAKQGQQNFNMITIIILKCPFEPEKNASDTLAAKIHVQSALIQTTCTLPFLKLSSTTGKHYTFDLTQWKDIVMHSFPITVHIFLTYRILYDGKVMQNHHSGISELLLV